MPEIELNGVKHYYEIKGTGPPLVLLHGGFVDNRMWDVQFEHFADRFRVLRYDLRGHGLTGRTEETKYTLDTFADDLHSLLTALSFESVILFGLSLGGMIAQSFAVKYSDKLRALILADTAVSVSLTLSDKFQRYILAPKWLMLVSIRWMTVPRFVDFSFRLAQWTRSSDWFGRDPKTMEYVRKVMRNVPTAEYLKIYDAIYEFDLLDLTLITVPTLILNGEFESKAVFRHTDEMLKLIPNSESHLVPVAGHTSNMENPVEFNRLVDNFFLKHEIH